MKTLMKAPVRYTTVKLIGRLLQPIAEAGAINIPELNEIMANLRHLAQKGELLPDMPPKLLTQREVAEMLNISFPHFRDLEREGHFTFRRKMVGTAVRYYNIEVVKYILSLDEDANFSRQAKIA